MNERNPCEKTYRINMKQKNLHMYSKLGSKLVRLLWSLMEFWNRLNQQQKVKKKEFIFFSFFKVPFGLVFGVGCLLIQQKKLWED